jgi:hypothetical protein
VELEPIAVVLPEKAPHFICKGVTVRTALVHAFDRPQGTHFCPRSGPNDELVIVALVQGQQFGGTTSAVSQIFAAATAAILAHRAHLAQLGGQPQPSAIRLPAHGFPALYPTFGPCRWHASESLAAVPAVRDRLARGRSRSPARLQSAADRVPTEVQAGF